MDKLISINSLWKSELLECFKSDCFLKLANIIEDEYKTKTIYPPKKDLFRAFSLCQYDKLKVIILGQDPYHGSGQANGLSFSVSAGVKEPPSLKNIKKEILSDIGVCSLSDGDLSQLATQGVLFLNSIMTVEASSPASHRDIGWEGFTDCVIKKISERKKNLVFLLWGNYAKSKETIIDTQKHLVLTSTHPSPFSYHKGFLGCKHFSKTNKYLFDNNIDTIDW